MITLTFGVGVAVSNRIMNVKGRGRYGGRRGGLLSGNARQLPYTFHIPAHFVVSILVPFQQALNARSACKKSHKMI